MDAGLLQKVFRKIQYERTRLAKIRVAYSLVLGLASLAIFVPIFAYFLREFSQSGFYQYLSLIGVANISYWKEFSLSLLESFPATSATAALSLILGLLLLFKCISCNTYRIFKTQTI